MTERDTIQAEIEKFRAKRRRVVSERYSRELPDTDRFHFLATIRIGR